MALVWGACRVCGEPGWGIEDDDENWCWHHTPEEIAEATGKAPEKAQEPRKAQTEG